MWSAAVRVGGYLTDFRHTRDSASTRGGSLEMPQVNTRTKGGVKGIALSLSRPCISSGAVFLENHVLRLVLKEKENYRATF